MMTATDFELFIFDLDDTLINTRQAYTMAQEGSVRLVFPDVSESQIKGYIEDIHWLCRSIGSGHTALYFRAFLESRIANPEKRPDLLNQLISSYEEYFWNNLQPFPGVTAFLENLRQSDKNISLVSNGNPVSQAKKLNQTGLNSFFPENTRFISGDYSGDLAKPSPFMIEQACRFFQADPERTVFFGNSSGDIMAGNLAGVTTVLFGQTYRPDIDLPRTALPDLQLDHWNLNPHLGPWPNSGTATVKD